jgi:hypothetical protein
VHAVLRLASVLATAALVAASVAATTHPAVAQDELRSRVPWSSHCAGVTTTGHVTFGASGAVTASMTQLSAGASPVRTKWKWTGHAATVKAPQTVCSSGVPVYELLLHGTFNETRLQAAGAPGESPAAGDAGAIPLTFDTAADAARAYSEIRCVLRSDRCAH